jgi:hypothetical protein
VLRPFASLLADRTIVLVDWYGHSDFGNGVLWASVEDSSRSLAHVCIDNRRDSTTRGRIFDGARHPSMPSASLVELGDQTEGDIVSLFSEWCDNPKHWLSFGGDYRDEFKEGFVKAILSIGAYR